MSDPKRAPIEFEKPPVVEVAIGVQFAPLTSVKSAHMGLLWSRFRNEFPKTEDQMTLSRAFEKFDKPEPPEILFEPATVTPRCWMLTEDGSSLLQVQQDRLVRNWRKVGPNTGYPRYAALRESFRVSVEEFQKFLAEEKLGTLKPDLCELTYIDNIEKGGIWEQFGQIDRVVTAWKNPTSEEFVLFPEAVDLKVRYILPDVDGKPVGRLHLNLDPVYRSSDRMAMLRLQTIARGTPMGEGLEGVLNFLDIAHEATGAAFLALTSKEIQRSWSPKTHA